MASDLPNESELTAKLLKSDGSSDKADRFDVAGAAAQSMLHSAFQAPMDAVTQIGTAGAHALGMQTKIEAPQLFKEPKQAEFGSAVWCAQTVGSGLGMVVPFLASEAAVSGLGKLGSRLGGARLATAIESTAAGAKYMPIARPIAHSVASGAMFGLVFTPSRDADGNFLADRLRNAAVGGITFGAQRAATIGITAGTNKLLSTGFETARQGAGDLSVMARLGQTESLLHNSVLTGFGRVGANALGGAIAGGVNANAHAFLYEGRAATKDEAWKSIASFVVTGGALDAAHLAGGKIAQSWNARKSSGLPDAARSEQAPLEEVQKSSGGSGGLADVHKRLTEGAESERTTAKPANSDMVEQAAHQLRTSIKSALRLDSSKKLSDYEATRDLDTLIDQLSAREHDIEGANANEVTRALRAVNSLVSADQTSVSLSTAARLAMAKQVLFETVNPKLIPTGSSATSPILAMEQSISYWNPGRYAEAPISLVTGGFYRSPGSEPFEVQPHPNHLAPDAVALQSLRDAMKPGYRPGSEHTYSGQLNEVLGLGLLKQSLNTASLSKLEPAHLMRLFDLKTGIHKPELTLKKPIGSHFGMVDRTGNLKIFADDTVWAELGTRINGAAPDLAGKANNAYYGQLELTNRADGMLPEDAVRLTEEILPTDHGFSKLVRVQNTSDRSVSLTVAEQLKPRVEDIFTGERGWVEPEPLPARLSSARVAPENGTVNITYTQTENAPKYTLQDGRSENQYHMEFAAMHARDASGRSVAEPMINPAGATYRLTLAPGEAHEYQVHFRTSVNKLLAEYGDALPFNEAKEVARTTFEDWMNSGTVVRINNRKAQAVFDRAHSDLAVLMLPTEEGGRIPAAGAPDFVTKFGRDDSISTKEALAYHPEAARDNLRNDARLQGQIFDDYTAQAPGKMIHEVRQGPLAKTLVRQPDGSYRSALPFARYYGSVDATPLFLQLMGKYIDQTGDLALVRELYPNIDKALQLMDYEIERGGGYLRYGGGGNEALSNQGWKDSGISVKNSQDQLSKAPIALAEPQGYLYEGWMQMAKIERLLAEQDPASAAQHIAKAEQLTQKAQALSERFQRDFWMKDKDFVALALDGHGNQADVVTSNPGHLLETGILPREMAAKVASRMAQPDMSSGFGVRTMAESETPYFANSYHNGPVWLHDVYSYITGAHEYMPGRTARISGEALSAVSHFPDARVPELWGGYGRNRYGIPIPYPRANSPQAWSAGAVLGILSANLGLRPQAWANNHQGALQIYKPMIPEGFGTSVELQNYRVGNKAVSLRFTKNSQGMTDVEVLSNPDNLAVKVVPHE